MFYTKTNKLYEKSSYPISAIHYRKDPLRRRPEATPTAKGRGRRRRVSPRAPPNEPSGQEGRRRSLDKPDGMPSAQLQPPGQVRAVSQPLVMRNGVVHAGPDPTACRQLSLRLLKKNIY
jgi:hypothetical protein